MQTQPCHGCGVPTHRCYRGECPDYGAMENAGVAFLQGGELYIGSRPEAVGTAPDTDNMVYPGLTRQARYQGKLCELARAIYHKFGAQIPTYPSFSEYLIRNDMRKHTPDYSLLLDHDRPVPWILLGKQYRAPPQEPAKPETVHTKISTIEDRGQTLFSYLDSRDLRVHSYPKDQTTWIQKLYEKTPAQRVTLASQREVVDLTPDSDGDSQAGSQEGVSVGREPSESRARMSIPIPAGAPKPTVRPGTPAHLDDSEVQPLYTAAQVHQIITDLDRMRSECPARAETYVDEVLRHPFAHFPDGAQVPKVGEARSTNDDVMMADRNSIGKLPDKRKRPRGPEDTPPRDADMGSRTNPMENGVKPVTILQRGSATSLPAGLLQNIVPKMTPEAAITEIIATLMGKSIPVPLRQLLALNDTLATAFVTFIEAQRDVSQVITVTDTGIPDDTYEARHGETAAVQTLLGTISEQGQDKPVHAALPFFMTLANGELALMNADVLHQFLSMTADSRRPGPDDPLGIPIERMTLSQRAKLVLATRYYHLPRLFIYLGEGDHKVCAILDTGSECNLIPWSLVESRGIAWSPTTTVSVGLHGKEAFMGECVVPVWLGPHVVSQHFFILDDKTKEYSVILGMPFIQNTKMTFDY